MALGRGTRTCLIKTSSSESEHQRKRASGGHAMNTLASDQSPKSGLPTFAEGEHDRRRLSLSRRAYGATPEHAAKRPDIEPPTRNRRQWKHIGHTYEKDHHEVRAHAYVRNVYERCRRRTPKGTSDASCARRVGLPVAMEDRIISQPPPLQRATDPVQRAASYNLPAKLFHRFSVRSCLVNCIKACTDARR